MGLSGWLLRAAAVRPRVLVVTALYGTPVRLAVEAEAARRGWLSARSPAEASVVAVCGSPDAALAEAIDVVWSDLPVPRALVHLDDPAEVGAAFDRATATLSDEPVQRHDAETRHPWRPDTPPAPMNHGDMPDHGGMDHGGMDHGDMNHGGMDHGEMDHGDMGHGDMGGHGHHMMGNPGGLKMADRGDDRDGLKLDRLHIPLGPILPDWPAGLVIHTVMQGDVIQQAHVSTAHGHGTPYWHEPWLSPAGATRGEAARRTAAAHLDSLTRLLGVAGWPGAAREAARLRDRTLAGAPVQDPYTRFARRVGRSRILAWMLKDIGVIDDHERGRDALDRTRWWLADTGRALAATDDPGPLEGGEGPTSPLPAVLPELLEGAELAAARLIVASLDPDLELPHG
ncbi:hypothetical protein [Nonomuraea sediminis]|uniref:hypothetical protein n=1 Tax=Nonomuraea sediminis TaxID=2835864 RepID=UPI001BDC942A|nr:hypothetical protein [Nonomuraea sediminis]